MIMEEMKMVAMDEEEMDPRGDFIVDWRTEEFNNESETWEDITSTFDYDEGWGKDYDEAIDDVIYGIVKNLRKEGCDPMVDDGVIYYKKNNAEFRLIHFRAGQRN